MKTVKVLKPYLNYKVGEVIQVRNQDAALLEPRGVVGEPDIDEGADEEITVKPAAKMTTKTIIKKK